MPLATTIPPLATAERRTGLAITSLPSPFQLLVWSYAIVVIVCFFAAPLHKFDGALPLVHGALLQQGYTPNLDFYSFYPPLSPILAVGVFSVFGKSVLAVRIVAAVSFILILLLLSRFYRSHFGPSGPLAPAAMLVPAIAMGVALNQSWWTGVSLALIALLTYLCSHSLSQGRLWAVGASGVLTALAILCRINFGAYVAFVITVDLILSWLLRGDAHFDRTLLKAEMKPVAVFAVPLVAVLLGVGFSVYGAYLAAAVSEFVITAQRVMAIRGFVRLPLSAELACALALPATWFFFRVLQDSGDFRRQAFLAAAFVPAMLTVAMVFRTRYSIAAMIVVLELATVIFLHVFVRRLGRTELSLLLFFCCLLHYFLSRVDPIHWGPIPIAFGLLLPLLLVPSRNPEETVFPPVAASGSALAILIVASFVFIVIPDFRPAVSNARRGLALLVSLVGNPHQADADLVMTSSSPPAEWSSVYPDLDEWKALRYLRARTSSSDPIFVGVADHSTVFWNNLRMYWLASRPIGVRTFQLEAKMASEAPVQREIIADLIQKKVSWLILDGGPDPDDGIPVVKGSALLDEYIANHYKEEARFGQYAVWSRAR